MNKTIQQKLATHFGVKSVEGSSSIKEINYERRTVEFIANTYFFIDSDQDMLVKGCCLKSINDRGPESRAVAKIKHQTDHNLDVTNVVGRIDTLEETNIGGRDVLYCASYIPENKKGDENLSNYQEGLYDNHSIGFRYKNIIRAAQDSPEQMEREAWDEFYPLAINPEKADELGYFWVIKEIELFEISVVSFGANKLTPYLGSKSKDKNKKIKKNLFERLDNLNVQLKSLSESKNQRGLINMEVLQMKQIITDLKLIEPSKKDTDLNQPSNKDTEEDKSKTINIITNLSKNYKK
jgi:phage head maturation protease